MIAIRVTDQTSSLDLNQPADRLDWVVGGQSDGWHTFIFLGIRTISIKLVAGGCLDAGSKPIKMLESSGEVSNIEWIKLGESLIADEDANGPDGHGPFDAHPKSDCPQLAVSYGFALPIAHERHCAPPVLIQPYRRNRRNDLSV